MQEIIAYKLVVRTNFHHLSDAVNEEISQGWQPIGGVSQSKELGITEPNPVYMQSMVKYKK